MNRDQLSNAHHNRGISLIEVVVGVSIMAFVLLFLLLTMTLFLETRAKILNDTKSLYLAEEGIEVLRHVRDDNWNDIAGLTIDTPHFLSISTTSIAITSTPEVIDGGWQREVVFHELYRDSATDDVVASTTGGSYVDTDGRVAIVRVGYAGSTTTVQTILTNLFDI